MRPILLVLAAGMGSRFGGLKQIEPVGPNGEWILDFSVFDAVESGFGKVVFVIREEMEDAFSVVRDRYAGRIDVEFAFQKSDDLPILQHLSQQREKPWGTGHAVYAARKAIDAPFAVINADDFYGRNAFRSLSAFLTQSPLEASKYALVGYQLENTLSEHGSVARGICHANADGLLESVEETTEICRDKGSQKITGLNSKGHEVPLSSKCPVSLNCWGFPASFLPELESLLGAFLETNGENPKTEFYLPFAVDSLLRSGKASARILECSDRWLGVTHREDLAYVKAEISKLFDQGDYTAPLW